MSFAISVFAISSFAIFSFAILWYSQYYSNLLEIEMSEEMDWGHLLFDKKIEEFHRNICSKIKSLDHLRYENNYNLFPNIENLRFYFNFGLEEVIPRLKLNKLRALELYLYEGEEHIVKTCVDFFPSLTSFDISFKSYDENAIYKSLEFISNLKHLIHFSFDGFAENHKLFCDSFKRMANKCQKLKSIATCLKMSKNSDLRQLLSPFEAFPSLKRLSLRLYGNLDIFSFEAFKGLSDITHLTLLFGWGSELKESILKDIDINLPNLQYLAIQNKG